MGTIVVWIIAAIVLVGTIILCIKFHKTWKNS